MDVESLKCNSNKEGADSSQSDIIGISRLILSALNYLKQVFQVQHAHFQLPSLQLYLIAQQKLLSESVQCICKDLFHIHKCELESHLTSANGQLAVLCTWLDKAANASVDFNLIAGHNLIDSLGRHIKAIAASHSGLLTKTSNHGETNDSTDRQSEFNSISSNLNKYLDDEKMMKSIIETTQRYYDMKLTDYDSAGMPVSGSGSPFANKNCSLMQASDISYNHVEADADSTESEEEVKEEFVRINGELYKRRYRKRRREKVVRSRTVVMSSGPPTAISATDIVPTVKTDCCKSFSDYDLSSKSQSSHFTSACASEESSRQGSYCTSTSESSSSASHTSTSGLNRLHATSNFCNSTLDSQPSPSTVTLRKPDEPSKRLVTQYMQIFAGYDRDIFDFTRYSSDSFNLHQTRWHKYVSSDTPLERCKTISLVTNECYQPHEGVYIHKNTTISHTARVRQVECVEGLPSLETSISSTQSADVSDENVYEKLPYPSSFKRYISVEASFDDADMEPYFYDSLDEFLIRDASAAQDRPLRGRISIQGGPLDALIVHACLPGSDNERILYCEAFATTYRCFTRTHELVGKLISRCIYMKSKEAELLWKSTFAFLIRIMDEVSVELDEELIGDLGILKQRFICDGLFSEAQLIKKATIMSRERQIELLSEAHLQFHASEETHFSIISKGCSRNIIQYSPKAVAEQITLMDAKLYKLIEIQEYLAFVNGKSKDDYPHLQNYINFFNKFGFWVKSLIIGDVQCLKIKEMEKFLSFFIKVAEEFKKHNNFNSYLSVVFTLISLDYLPWSKRSRQKLKEYQNCLTDQNAFGREYFAKMNETQPPLVPHVGEVLKYLTRIHEAISSDSLSLPDSYPLQQLTDLKMGPIINFWKCWMSFNCLDFCIKFKRFSSKSMLYNFAKNDDIVQCISEFSEALPEKKLNEYTDVLRNKFSK